MRKLYKLITLLIAIILSTSLMAQWATVGSAGFSSGSVNYVDIAINSSGTPYVTFKDVENSGKATVMKLNGESWELVGNAGFSAGSTD